LECEKAAGHPAYSLSVVKVNFLLLEQKMKVGFGPSGAPEMGTPFAFACEYSEAVCIFHQTSVHASSGTGYERKLDFGS
jgi:hypothetical protein